MLEKTDMMTKQLSRRLAELWRLFTYNKETTGEQKSQYWFHLISSPSSFDSTANSDIFFSIENII